MILFETSLKVRSYECDMYGHVNNATFLNYCEFSRVEFLEKIGYTLTSLKRAGFLLPIVKIEIEYKKPVYAGDVLNLTVKWLRRGRSSSTFEQEIYNQKTGELAAIAWVTWVVTDLKGKPISIPQELLDSVNDTFHELPPKKSNE